MDAAPSVFAAGFVWSCVLLLRVVVYLSACYLLLFLGCDTIGLSLSLSPNVEFIGAYKCLKIDVIVVRSDIPLLFSPPIFVFVLLVVLKIDFYSDFYGRNVVVSER